MPSTPRPGRHPSCGVPATPCPVLPPLHCAPGRTASETQLPASSAGLGALRFRPGTSGSSWSPASFGSVPQRPRTPALCPAPRSCLYCSMAHPDKCREKRGAIRQSGNRLHQRPPLPKVAGSQVVLPTHPLSPQLLQALGGPSAPAGSQVQVLTLALRVPFLRC